MLLSECILWRLGLCKGPEVEDISTLAPRANYLGQRPEYLKV